MNKVLVCIGSNNNREFHLTLCRKLLSQHFSTITYSQEITTQALGENYEVDFNNQLMIIETANDINSLELTFKNIELEIGRKSEDKASGLVKIDIDLLQWNDIIVRPKDMERPYISLLLQDLNN